MSGDLRSGPGHAGAADVCDVLETLLVEDRGWNPGEVARHVGPHLLPDRARRVLRQLAAFGWVEGAAAGRAEAWRLTLGLPMRAMAWVDIVNGAARRLALGNHDELPVDTSIHQATAYTCLVVRAATVGNGWSTTRVLSTRTSLDRHSCRRIARSLADRRWLNTRLDDDGAELWFPGVTLLSFGTTALNRAVTTFSRAEANINALRHGGSPQCRS